MFVDILPLAEARSRLSAHAELLGDEARAVIRATVASSLDPAEMDGVLERYEGFGDKLSEPLHALRVSDLPCSIRREGGQSLVIGR